ncbi:sugar kinase [Paracoccus aminophilus]|uniref:2-dehydro-3-deoxygluconokinase n=1 Tax=Paracoccus aminophilus JCM 7686 TaxID=1367847 RepID=S5Y537_PARAH|nr:sugar kinase [Paracoccus aminophilus]AGT10850.1 2-dehydro-3-deoxygluconokinase [Paracoccus aminophilus JCM 7686]
MSRFVSVGEAMLELSPLTEADSWRGGFAGDTLNTAWYARRALPGDWRVDYHTGVGVDAVSDRMLDFIASAGIGTETVLRDPARTIGLYMISLKDGERSFTYWRSASAARRLADESAVLKRAFAGAAMIYLSGITLAILAPEARARLFAHLAEARAGGARLAFDPNIRPSLWESAETLRMTITETAAHADIILPSHDDEAAHFGDASPEDTVARYLAAGVPEVVVKNAGGPVLLATDGQFSRIDTDCVTLPVDTTGAGDSFNGAYLAARLLGRTPVEAVAAGQAQAAAVIMHRGALMPMG